MKYWKCNTKQEKKLIGNRPVGNLKRDRHKEKKTKKENCKFQCVVLPWQDYVLRGGNQFYINIQKRILEFS